MEPRRITALSLPGLRIDIRPRPSFFDRWFDCSIEVDGFPFSGTVETIFTDEDLTTFASSLDALDPSGEAVLGGGRAAEVRLIVEEQQGGEPGSLAVECSVTTSGDDPWPLLSFLMFGVSPPGLAVGGHLRELAAIEPWPKPRLG